MMASTLSKQSALARERERDAFRLRADGLTYEQIAVRLGYARANGAHRACMRAYRRLNAQVPIENDHRRTATARLICEAANTMAPRVGTGRLTDSDAAKALRRRLAYLTARLRVPGLTNRLLEHRDHAATARALAWWDELQQLRKEARQ